MNKRRIYAFPDFMFPICPRLIKEQRSTEQYFQANSKEDSDRKILVTNGNRVTDVMLGPILGYM